MSKLLPDSSPPIPLLIGGFIAGVIVVGIASGVFTGAAGQRTEQARSTGYEAGYAAALAERPALLVEDHAIRVFSNAIFMENLEVELKAVAQLTNAIDFNYGEKGAEREQVSALNPGDAIARRIGDYLYVIKNVSVSANLERATVQVTRITLPPN